MADKKSFEIQNAFRRQIEELDKTYLRPIQREMYECAAKCCNNRTGSTEEVDACIDRCSAKNSESRNYVSSQFNNYQERLQRCVNQCNDEAKDRLGPRPTETEIEKASKLFESCASGCIDKHMDLLPQFVARMHQVLGTKISPSPSSSPLTS